MPSAARVEPLDAAARRATCRAPDRSRRMPLPPGVTPEPAGPGRESVWAYPRPAVAEPTPRALRIVHRGETVAESRRALRVLETSHPPVYYFPPEDVRATLRLSGGQSLCEWKGRATWLDVVAGGATLADAAWRYDRPTPGFAALAGFVAFHAGPFDACTVDGEAVTPQPGGFYGGWITADLAGPFKGVPGSRFW
jgi:uncharacterized protein (DUF427 family)